MAAKTPTLVRALGKMNGLRLIQAVFDGTVSSNDIDNTDTWASGINGIVMAQFCPTTSTGVVGCSVSGSTITFAGSGDSNVGSVLVYAR